MNDEQEIEYLKLQEKLYKNMAFENYAKVGDKFEYEGMVVTLKEIRYDTLYSRILVEKPDGGLIHMQNMAHLTYIPNLAELEIGRSHCLKIIAGLDRALEDQRQNDMSFAGTYPELIMAISQTEYRDLAETILKLLNKIEELEK